MLQAQGVREAHEERTKEQATAAPVLYLQLSPELNHFFSKSPPSIILCRVTIHCSLESAPISV